MSDRPGTSRYLSEWHSPEGRRVRRTDIRGTSGCLSVWHSADGSRVRRTDIRGTSGCLSVWHSAEGQWYVCAPHFSSHIFIFHLNYMFI